MTKQKDTWPKIRKLFNDIHLWLGLISGIIIFFICLSGTIYVFNTELKEIAAPHLYRVAAFKKDNIPEKLETASLISVAEKEGKGKASAIKIPFDISKTYIITIKKPEDGKEKHNEAKDSGKKENQVIAGSEKQFKNLKSDKKEGKGVERGGRGTQYMVNPYSGIIVGDSQSSKTFTSEFMQLMFSLHRWLLLDKIEEPIFGSLENRKLGSYISGTATILFTLGVITGIVIWFPQKLKSWRQGLKIKTSGNWKRLNHDLHNSLGFYSCIFLLLMGLTGPQWSFPWYREGLRKSLGTYQPEGQQDKKQATSLLKAGYATLPVEEFLKIADTHLPYEGDYQVMLPSDSLATVTIMKNKIGFFAPAAADRIVLDQYSGAIIEKEIFKDKAFNERVSSSIKALHIGDVYGTFSKILYFLACLIATSLPVTGTIIWVNKLKKKRKPMIN